MEETDMFIQADQFFESILTQVEDDQWDAPVPTAPDWNVRELVNHVARNNLEVIATVTDGRPSREDDVLGEEPIEAWSAAAQTAEEAVESIDDYDKTIDLPIGSFTLTDFLKLHTIDRTIHAWDLANALGTDVEVEPALAEKAYHYAQKFADKVRDIGEYGEEVAVGGNATAMEKLLALSGRQD
jgi:uncharacterized protein (TIGR03086 family)